MSRESDLARITAVIHGRVQGVGFRAYVQREAAQLGCHGYVRNLADGSTVEVVAEGDKPALLALIEALRRGPRLAHVADVVVEWADAIGDLPTFTMC